MTRALALDVSDAGLLAVAEGGAFFGPSPGYALADGEELVVGGAALRRARLKPRFVFSRFWERLDAEPLGRPFADGLTSADLVYAHLKLLWERTRAGVREVVLALPGRHDERQMGLLLGIAQALDMPVIGLVDAALAAASAFPGERLLHVDLGLHRTAVTELRRGDSLVRERVATMERWGLEDVQDALARRIAEAFVKKTRFDPLHAAETEQALHDALPPWLARIEREPRIELTLEADGARHTVDCSRADLETWARTFVDELTQQVSLLKRPGEPTTLLLTARAARLPGLLSRLAETRGVEVAVAPEQAAAAGALRARKAVRSPAGALRFVTRLPPGEGSPAEGSVGGQAVILRPMAGATASTSGTRRPTHVLLGHKARAITAAPLVLGIAPPEGSRGLRLEGDTAGVSRAHCRLFESAGEVVLEDLSTYGTFVNGERVNGRAVLAAGDRLRLGGIELLLVAAEE